MGMIRKTLSVGTLGMVSFHAPREKRANAARRESKAAELTAKAQADLLAAQAELAREQARQLREGPA